ncbi:hypothetical protein [Actinokineospora sp. HUAS TT18]|uniref:hypothetical protein n=1 Tax=Actinokineospora sp. HUAS TT18 TaxID=3447451 RepID=UPI003F51F82A
MILEIRTYKVKPGRLDDLVAVMREVRPMLEAAGIDVVDLGPSLVPDEGDHAYLLRAFESVEARDRLEEAFYSGEAWRDGPRARVLDPIDSYQTVVLDVPEAVVDGLRKAG